MAPRRSKKKTGREKLPLRFEELMDKLKEHGLLAGQKVVVEPSSEVKMSEVIMDFVEPYRDYAHTYEEFNELIALAVVTWNAALLPEDEGEKMVDRLTGVFSPSEAEDFKEIVETLMERKRRYFSDNKRLILDYHVSDSGEDFYLSVASTL
jgi:hypothetical protein